MDSIQQRSDYTADQILCAALDVGEHILKNGGEIHRVEDTIERISKSFGAVYSEVFCITTLIVASVRLPDGGYSHQIRRVNKTKNNLDMLESMNEISRELCAGTLKIEDLRGRIEDAKQKKTYPNFVYYIAAVVGAGAFAMFFGGSFFDGLCAAVVGLAITFSDRHLPKFINPLITTIINSMLGGVLAILFYKLGVVIGLNVNLDMIMIGTIMLLIPGLALGNAIRDMLGGDIVSGVMRMIQSILVALMIAAGYAVAILLLGGVV